MNASKKLASLVGVIMLSAMILNLISIQQLRQNQMHNLLQYRQTAVRHPKIIRTLMNTSLKIRLRQLIMRNPVLFIQPTICFR